MMDQAKQGYQKLGTHYTASRSDIGRLVLQPYPSSARRTTLRQVLGGAKKSVLVLGSVSLFLILFKLLRIFWSDHVELDLNNQLRFSDDGQFKITVFEDLHFGEGEDNPPEWGWGPASDLKTIKVMESVLDSEEQDFVVLNGDLITGENTHQHNSTRYLDMIVAPLVERQIRWASTYGNHDRDINLSPEQLLHAEQEYSLSLTRQMVAHRYAGVTNYVVAVGSDLVQGPALLIWFFDSKGGKECASNNDGTKSCSSIAGTVHPSVAKWFRQASKNIEKRYEYSIPSIAFVHIPIHAMKEFQHDAWESHRSPGINDDEPLASQGETDNGAYTGEDRTFMQALQETEGLMAVFSGHDHGNDWCQKWSRRNNTNDLFLCFGRHTGYGGYGKWMRGARQIQVSLDKGTHAADINTWIRLEDGSVSGRIHLNSSFGSDYYPKVRRRFSA